MTSPFESYRLSSGVPMPRGMESGLTMSKTDTQSMRGSKILKSVPTGKEALMIRGKVTPEWKKSVDPLTKEYMSMVKLTNEEPTYMVDSDLIDALYLPVDETGLTRKDKRRLRRKLMDANTGTFKDGVLRPDNIPVTNEDNLYVYYDTRDYLGPHITANHVDEVKAEIQSKHNHDNRYAPQPVKHKAQAAERAVAIKAAEEADAITEHSTNGQGTFRQVKFVPPPMTKVI